MLLKNITLPSDNKLGLNFPVWDPRVITLYMKLWVLEEALNLLFDSFHIVEELIKKRLGLERIWQVSLNSGHLVSHSNGVF